MSVAFIFNSPFSGDENCQLHIIIIWNIDHSFVANNALKIFNWQIHRSSINISQMVIHQDGNFIHLSSSHFWHIGSISQAVDASK